MVAKVLLNLIMEYFNVVEQHPPLSELFVTDGAC